jgi:hypothetical protein
MPASHFDVKPMTGRPKFIVRHSTSILSKKLTLEMAVIALQYNNKNLGPWTEIAILQLQITRDFGPCF